MIDRYASKESIFVAGHENCESMKIAVHVGGTMIDFSLFSHQQRIADGHIYTSMRKSCLGPYSFIRTPSTKQFGKVRMAVIWTVAD